MTPQSSIAHYRVSSKLGEGGMGAVYRATDTKLNREVAIKVLPESFAADPDRLARFTREAQVLASLNHPNICTIHDVGPNFLVMEHIEGETLARRLERGPLSLAAALKIGMEIASALNAAHARGIIHRDLKPANIILAKSGAKLLDFGLAKPPAGADALGGETRTMALTKENTLVGTLQYMAPEQLEGKEADARSDLFAFGAVLYEMLAGRSCFAGSSQASIIAAILERAPEPLSRIQPQLPPALDHLIDGCLEKDRERRRQTAHDVMLDLEWIARDPLPTGTRHALRPLPRWAPAAAAVAIVLAGALGWLVGRPRISPARVVRLSMPAPAGQTLGGSWWWRPSLAISPDGSRIAFIAAHNGVSQLYLRDLNDFQPRAVAGTEGADQPTFSPDGQWISILTTTGKLLKLPSTGGPPQTIGELPVGDGPFGLFWAADGFIYSSCDSPLGIVRVPALGGPMQRLTMLDAAKHETDHRWPEVLPGGKNLLFTVRTAAQPNFDEADIAVVSLGGGERKILIKGGAHAHYSATGHLLFMRQGVLMAAPFDVGRLEVTGAALPVLENVVENPRIGAGQYSMSADGSLVYIAGGVSFGEHELVYYDHSGKSRVLTSSKRPYEDFSISPDGRFIAATIEGPVTNTWLIDIARDSEQRLNAGVEDRDPAWTTDGKRIAYSAYQDGQTILWKPVDGSGPEEVLVRARGSVYPWFWTPDGSAFLYAEMLPESGWHVMILPTPHGVPSSQHGQPLVATGEWATVSPDGRWLAYSSPDSGQQEVYVTSFPTTGAKVRVSNDGGVHPFWAPNGRELYYRSTSHIQTLLGRTMGQRGRIMAVAVETSPTFEPGTPRMLFEGSFFESA